MIALTRAGRNRWFKAVGFRIRSEGRAKGFTGGLEPKDTQYDFKVSGPAAGRTGEGLQGSVLLSVTRRVNQAFGARHALDAY